MTQLGDVCLNSSLADPESEGQRERFRLIEYEGPECQDFQVIVSHPARQGFVYHVPLAIQRQGIPVKFLTGLYYKANQLPYSLVKYLPFSNKRAALWRQLEKRRLPGLKPESVISLGGPWVEMIFRPLALLNAWQEVHDWLASRWIERLSLPSTPTLLHCFDGSAKRTLLAARRKGITTVYEITVAALAAMSLEAEERRRFRPTKQTDRSRQRWSKRLLEENLAADYLVAQSRVTKDHLFSLGVDPRKIILMPLGVDTNRFQPVAMEVTSRPFRCLFVGQLGIRKGLHHLLEAWKQLNLPNAELVLAGAIVRGELGDEILEKYRGTYCRLGFVEGGLRHVYQDSDIFVLPSLSEGASMAMMEAMASGLPCIVSSNVGCILRDGVEGYVVPVGDVESLKDRIRRLYLNAELRRTMGTAARLRAEQFTWQEYGRRLVHMYRKIVGGERESATDILDMTEL